MGNYIVAADIIKECETRPVIMDRLVIHIDTIVKILKIGTPEIITVIALKKEKFHYESWV